MDTKQFVKTYIDIDDLLHLSVPANVKNLKPTRVLVTAIIDRSNSGPKVSGLGGAIMGKNRRKLGVESKPPPEIVLLPVPCTLGELKKEATKAFADLYVILSKFKVTAIKGYEPSRLDEIEQELAVRARRSYGRRRLRERIPLPRRTRSVGRTAIVERTTTMGSE